MIFIFKGIHSCQLIYLTTFGTCETYELDPTHFFTTPELAWKKALKVKVKLDLLTDIDMLLMVEKGIRNGICHAFIDLLKQITFT